MDVVRLGALADLVDDARTLAVSVSQFADLADGRRVVFDERGFSLIPRGGLDVDGLWARETFGSIERIVRAVVGPEDDQGSEPLPWEHIAQQLHRHGIDVTADELRRVPHVVEFAEPLQERLGGPQAR